jgi:hypothetical protein
MGPFLPSIQTSFGTLFPFRLILPVYLLTLIVAILLYDAYHIQIPRATTALFAFLVLGVFSTLLAVPTGINISGVVVLAARFSLLFGIILTLNNRRWVYGGWMLLLSLAVISFGVASVEIFTGWHWSGSRLTQLSDAPRYSNWASAWYHNVNNFSLFVLIATIPALVMALDTSIKRGVRAVSALIWIIGLLIILQIYSRAVIWAYPVTIITAITLMRSYDIQTLLCRVPVRASKIVVPPIGVSLAGIFYFMPNPISNVGSSLWTRWQLQKAATLVGGVFGQGFGSASAIISKAPINTDGITAPHSWYGAIVSETGIVGLILFLIFYVGLLTDLLRMSDRTDPVQIMSVTALVALPLGGLGPSNVFRVPIWWIALGLSVSTCNYLMSDPVR